MTSRPLACLPKLLVPLLIACGSTAAGPQQGADGGADAANQTEGSSDAAPAPSRAPSSEPVCGAAASCTRTMCAALGPEDCTPSFVCPGKALCEEAHFAETGGSADPGSGAPARFGTNGPDTEKNARCILEALRDGKEGTWSWAFDGGTHSYREVVWIVGGHAFGTFSEALDSPSARGGYVSVPLKPTSYFETCLAANDLDAYAHCLKDASEVCP